MLFTDLPLEPFGKTLLDISVPSRLGFKTPLVFRCLKLLKENAYLPPRSTHMAELCFEEVLANAIMHGNKLDEAKTVRVQLFGDDQRWGLIVEDQGQGFSPQDVPDPDAALDSERGRGIMLIRHYMEKLQYNRKGNKVMMVRLRQTTPDPEPVIAGAAQARQEDTSHYEPAVAYGQKLHRVELSEDIELDAIEEHELPVSGDGLVAVNERSGVRVVKLEVDRLTEDNASQVQEPLYAACDAKMPIVLDLSQIAFLASKGISLVLAANKRVMQDKRKCVIAAAAPAVAEIFKATGLGKLLRFIPTVDEAVAAVK